MAIRFKESLKFHLFVILQYLFLNDPHDCQNLFDSNPN